MPEPYLDELVQGLAVNGDMILKNGETLQMPNSLKRPLTRAIKKALKDAKLVRVVIDDALEEFSLYQIETKGENTQ